MDSCSCWPSKSGTNANVAVEQRGRKRARGSSQENGGLESANGTSSLGLIGELETHVFDKLGLTVCIPEGTPPSDMFR